MRGRAELTAAAPIGGRAPFRLVRVRDEAPVAWRVTPEAVYLVGTAAAPAGDDQVRIDLSVGAGAELAVRSTAATVAWRSQGTGQDVRIEIAEGGRLDWRLEPLIATAGCRHRQHVAINMQGAARLDWTEEVLVGRHDETPGPLDLRFDIDLDGMPLLRHQMVLGSGEGWDGPAGLGPHRAFGLRVRAGAGDPGLAATGPGWARFPLSGPATLSLAVAADLPALRTALGAASSESAFPG